MARAASVLVSAGLLTALAAGSGGYFPRDWGIVLLAGALLAAGALLLRDRLDLGRLDLCFAGGLALFAAWTLLSATWAQAAGPAVQDGELALLYAAGAAATLLALPGAAAETSVRAVALAAAAVSTYGLATHLVPDRVGGTFDPATSFQVEDPIGYANAAGIVAVIGFLLAGGIVLHGRRVERAVAAAALVPLGATTLFSFSRGSLVALVVAVPVLVALEPARGEAARRLALVLVPVAIGVVLGLRTPALVEEGRSLADVAHAGHRLAVVLSVLAAAAAAAALGFDRFAALRGRRVWTAGVVGGAAVAVLVLVATGAPRELASRAADAFREQPTAPAASIVGRRLLTTSGNRPAYWRVALDVTGRHPLIGAGGGMYERSWLRERTIDEDVRNAHSLYVETLAELGAVGLLVLLAALAAPLVALPAARRSLPLAPAAAAAYAAYLVHAGLDWDWELPAVTFMALGCAVPLVAAARPRAAAYVLTPARRAAGLAVVAPFLVAALVMHVGNRAAAASADAVLADDPAEGVRQAHRAERWEPWSAEGPLLLGQAFLSEGRLAEARASLERAIGRDPGDWVSWYALAAASEGEAALRAIERATELNPRSPDVAALRESLRTNS